MLICSVLIWNFCLYERLHRKIAFPVKPKFGVAPLLVQIELIFSNNKQISQICIGWSFKGHFFLRLTAEISFEHNMVDFEKTELAVDFFMRRVSGSFLTEND